jgi:hypothetical protein
MDVVCGCVILVSVRCKLGSNSHCDHAEWQRTVTILKVLTVRVISVRV